MAPIARWLEAAPAGWDALRREDPNATPAHRSELARAMADTLSGHTAWFIAIEEGESLVGGAPVIVERRLGLEWIRALPYTLPGSPLARAGRHAAVDRAIANALEARARETGAVGGEWVLYRPHGPQAEPAALEILSGETLTMTTAVIDLTGGAAAALRRVERRARESVANAAAPGLRCAEETGALEETYALYAAQARHWPGHRPRSLALLRRLIEGNPPAARLFTVRDARGLLSGALALVGEHEWMPWWSGSHPDARRRHAFTSLMWDVAERAAAAGATRFNLGASAGRDAVATFKKALGARDHLVTIRWIGADHAGPWGRVVAALQSRLRAGRWRGASV